MIRVNPTVLCFVFGPVISLLVGCGSGGDGPTGATASLSWEPGHDQPDVTYTLHYGKNPSGAIGSCNYEQAVDVADPFVTISGLDYSSHYYFAVSAYDNSSGSRSVCSDEVSKLTPDQGQDPPVNI